MKVEIVLKSKIEKFELNDVVTTKVVVYNNVHKVRPIFAQTGEFYGLELFTEDVHHIHFGSVVETFNIIDE